MTCVFCMSVHASRPTISFSYDGAGNRIKKELRIGMQYAPADKAAYVSEMLSDKTVRIYPNSPSGFLTVEISGLEGSDHAEARLFSLSGQQMNLLRLEESQCAIDMRDFDNGVYILHIILNRKETSWRIIKE